MNQTGTFIWVRLKNKKQNQKNLPLLVETNPRQITLWVVTMLKCSQSTKYWGSEKQKTVICDLCVSALLENKVKMQIVDKRKSEIMYGSN